MQLLAQHKTSYSFIVAGHAYGAHATQSNGLHPKFLESLNAGFDTSARFIILTGDIVNNSTVESWQQVEQELANYKLTPYYVMGNHDDNEIGIAVFEEKYGKTYYAFDYRHERFIILNSIEADRAISTAQLNFLDNQLKTLPDTIKNIFIFFHEVIWNSHEKYKGVLSNSRSRYDQMVAYSNYWQEVHPLLEKYPAKKIFVIAGDVGGNPDATATFYDQWGHITLLASGMGEVADENYLLISLLTDETVALKPVALNDAIAMKSIEYYSVPKKPEFIEPDTFVELNMTYAYTVSEIGNADSYAWELPENTVGESTSNSINVVFEIGFVSGNISVSASNTKFGSSEPVSQMVLANTTSLRTETIDMFSLCMTQTNCHCILKIWNELSNDLTVEILDLNGRIVYSEKLSTFGKFENQIELPRLPVGIYLVSLTNNKIKKVKKIYLR